MKSKRRAPIDTVLLIPLILSVLELVLFIVLKAESSRCANSAFNRFSYIVVNRYSYIFDIVNDLSLAYVMSYFFYIVVLIPDRRKQQSINKYVGIYLTNISHLLDDIIRVSHDFSNAGGKILNNSPNSNSVLRRETGRFDFMTYKEHFTKFYRQFVDEYQHLSHYIAFINDELRDCLYEIVTCDFLNRINDLLVNTNNNEFDNVFEENFSDTAITELNARLKQFF